MCTFPKQPFMPTPLEDIRFLADSENRFTALKSLEAGSQTRSEVQTATGASKATISRILRDFEERGWADRDGHQYALTPLGEYVANTFVDLHEHMSTAADLRELLPWFPLAELDVEFDLEVLTGARVTAATPENPMAPVARVLAIERESTRTKTLADRLPESCIKARHEAVVEHAQTSELITTRDVAASVIESPYSDKFGEIVAADHSTVYVSEGDVPPGGIHDGTAYLIIADDQDVNVGVIESDDPAIVEELTETFESLREAATPLSSADLETQESIGV